VARVGLQGHKGKNYHKRKLSARYEIYGHNAYKMYIYIYMYIEMYIKPSYIAYTISMCL